MSVKITRGDTVEIIAGDDKGHRGEVQRVIKKKNKDGTYDPNRVYVLVAGANLVIKHQGRYGPCAHADGPDRDGSAHPHQQRDVGRGGWQADAGRV